MEQRELICINCPLGCALTVTLEDKDVVKAVSYTHLDVYKRQFMDRTYGSAARQLTAADS